MKMSVRMSVKLSMLALCCMALLSGVAGCGGAAAPPPAKVAVEENDGLPSGPTPFTATANKGPAKAAAKVAPKEAPKAVSDPVQQPKK